MENHAALLENLCRMCGNKVLLKKGYVNAKTCYDYVDILQTFYGILESEDREVLKNIFLSQFLAVPKLAEKFCFFSFFVNMINCS